MKELFLHYLFILMQQRKLGEEDIQQVTPTQADLIFFNLLNHD